MQTASKDNRLSGLTAVLGLLTLLVGLIVMILLPNIRLAAWGILLLGIILLATAFIMDYRRVGRALTGKRGRFSTGTTVMASIFIGIILLVNAISIGNYHRFDATGVAQFTLTSQTKDVLSKMETPVKALCFFTPGNPVKEYTSGLLNEYQNYTDQLSIENIDPDEHPDQARQYDVTGYAAEYGTVVFKSDDGGQREVFGPQIMEKAENSFTSAILEVTGIVQKKVYFLTGHGENSISADYSDAKQGLLDNLYNVDTLDLLRTPNIPEDCAALIIAAPQKPLTSDEVEIIERYLENGGWALILINPNSPQEIRQLLSAWGSKIEDGTVIDPSSYYTVGDPSMDKTMDKTLVPRIRNFFDLSATYFPGATAIIPHEKIAETIEQHLLVWTSEESWLEKHFETGQEPAFNEGTDLKGPFALGVLIITTLPEEPEKQAEFRDTRIIVIGDSDFASNQNFYAGDNGNLFLNLVEYLTVGKELISIERKVLPFRRLVAGPEAINFMRISSIGLLPLLVLIAGSVIWWRRR
ncbi:GldG family protein [Chloroflexota bacterium]